MPRPVYSKLFLALTASDISTPYVVPAGYTAVVRDYIAYQNSSLWHAVLALIGPGGTPSFVPLVISVTEANVSAVWQGRIVVPEGWTFEVAVSPEDSSIGVYVGGYLLTNT